MLTFFEPFCLTFSLTNTGTLPRLDNMYSLCPYYAIRAHICNQRAGTWNGYQDSVRCYRPRLQRHNAECLHPLSPTRCGSRRRQRSTGPLQEWNLSQNCQSRKSPVEPLSRLSKESTASQGRAASRRSATTSGRAGTRPRSMGNA